MKPGDRQLLIIDILHQHGRVSVKQLVDQLGISAETIRRDLNALSIAGKLHKTHGGAVLPQILGEGPFQQRMGENVSAKRQIAKKACELIVPGETIFIDTGSTTLAFAEELSLIDNLTIITNSADIAKIMGSNDSTQVFLVGGLYSADNRETIGPMVISQLSQFRVKHSVLTIGGIHATAGITDFNINEAYIGQAMIKQAENVIVLADSSKMDQIAPFEVAILEQLSYLVCQSEPGQALAQALEVANVTVSFVD